ncbi:MAG: terpene cyclase/mutase family protein [Gemmataceae bacterium]|nr:terpene cyclase/mutase family protein [Gemmataceae bacterium]
MKAHHWLASLIAVAVLATTQVQSFGQEVKPVDLPKPKPNSADEPMAPKLSLAKSAEFLDAVNVNWTSDKKCGTCHTNYPYLMARPVLKEGAMAGHDEVRKFFEERIAGWETDKGKPRWDTEVVATAATLAFNDAHTTGKLHPLTKKALDKMWTLQQKNGAWNWLKCTWPPFEHDDYYGAVFVAVCVGHAPDNYAASDSAKDGMAKLRDYLQKTPAPDIHHKAWLMWASLKLDGLMTKEQREQTVKELLALQRPDGGWNLPSLGDWKGKDPNHVIDKNAPSDGYGTGFVVHVLRQAGVPAKNEAIQKGVKWLQTNQRESGRWYTRSLNTDKHHYITNAGTAYAILALKACE